tara:strand:+ start:208 stop:465 length:258 start_codon:yes stop_codon:yes gene_type:complete
MTSAADHFVKGIIYERHKPNDILPPRAEYLGQEHNNKLGGLACKFRAVGASDQMDPDQEFHITRGDAMTYYPEVSHRQRGGTLHV